MPFVNEKISEEDKARIDWRAYKEGYAVRRRPFDPFMWTIDRGRGVFFVRIGKRIPGPHVAPEGFGLNWKGTLIRFFAWTTLKTDPGATKSDIYWKFNLRIPDALIADTEESQTVLKEAIEAYGYMYERGNIRDVHILISLENQVSTNVTGAFRVINGRDLFYAPATPRYGIDKDAPLGAKERALDQILTDCFEFVGLTPWNTGPVYIVDTPIYSFDSVRSDGSEIVITERGIVFREDPSDYRVQKFDGFVEFLLYYVGRWIEMISQRDAPDEAYTTGFLLAKKTGNFADFFKAHQEKIQTLQHPMRMRLSTYMTSPQVLTASKIIDNINAANRTA